MNILINEELAEEIGWHLGDGSMNYYPSHDGKEKRIYQLRGHISDDRSHYIERIKPLFEKVYGFKISLREMPSTRVFGFQIWNDSIVNFKESLGLPLGKKTNISIPFEFFQEEKLAVACVRGIFDTDGCLSIIKKNNKLYPRIQIVTISKKLAEQMNYIFDKVKLRSFISEEKQKINSNRLTTYRINVVGVEMLKMFMDKIEPRNPKHIKKYQTFLASIPKA